MVLNTGQCLDGEAQGKLKMNMDLLKADTFSNQTKLLLPRDTGWCSLALFPSCSMKLIQSPLKSMKPQVRTRMNKTSVCISSGLGLAGGCYNPRFLMEQPPCCSNSPPCMPGFNTLVTAWCFIHIPIPPLNCASLLKCSSTELFEEIVLQIWHYLLTLTNFLIRKTNRRSRVTPDLQRVPVGDAHLQDYQPPSSSHEAMQHLVKEGVTQVEGQGPAGDIPGASGCRYNEGR